nr:MAG TPA: hypothetical protein [Caudoviricetes sp.]
MLLLKMKLFYNIKLFYFILSSLNLLVQIID